MLRVLSVDNIQGVPEKTVQSLVYLNFATVSHRVVQFSLKCSAEPARNELIIKLL